MKYFINDDLALSRPPEGPVTRTLFRLPLASIEARSCSLRARPEGVETAQIYLEATLAMKEAALAKTLPYSGRSSRFRPDDNLLEFLNSL